MPDLDIDVENWPDASSDSVWERNPVTNRFSLVSFRGKQVDRRWSASDIARALNCGFSYSRDDCASDSDMVVFPPEFKYSPNTGKPIDKKNSRPCTWLPTNGNEDLKSGLVRGGCLTSHPLGLKEGSDLGQDPDRELPLPGPGHYRFCSGSFGLLSSFLIALEPEQGEIYCWLSSLGEWSALTSESNSPCLISTTLQRGDWSIEALDLAGETILFWPADAGLIAIKIDMLSLSYEAQVLVEGVCLSIPRVLRDKIYVLIEKPDRAVGAFSAGAGQSIGNDFCELAVSDIPNTRWVIAAATPREIIWLSDMGQVVVRPSAQQYMLIPWEAGTEPQFQLGGPHCSSDGRLYMQVLHPTLHDGEGGFGYVQLGHANSNQRPHLSFGARMLTGQSSIKVEKWLKEDPWIEPTVVATMAHENDEAVVPILESKSDMSLLVLRVDHLQGITALFERTEEFIPTRFQIMGQHGNSGCYLKRLREPWNASAFVFEGVLFIYHPDIGSLPGWLIKVNAGD